jgi:glycosyltransferase involved in cell wall biosynthesis
MHVLFVHQSYPAQFGQLARWLVSHLGWQSTFISEDAEGSDAGVQCLRYEVAGGATELSHYCSRTFENTIWQAYAVYEACKHRLSCTPDVVVGHSGLTSTLFLRNLFECPTINYFEYFYRRCGGDIDFRPEYPAGEMDYLRAQARNATILLDLENCDAGWCATEWQRSLFPSAFRSKLEVIFDGVDTAFWYRRPDVPRCVAGREIPPGTRIVTYVSRGFESMRGFDIFMGVARRVYESYPDVLFLVVGSDRMYYGGDERFIQAPSFKEQVLSQGNFDLSKFHFTGWIPPEALVALLSLSDLHIYLTVPFVLSWSLFNALACGCVVLASATPPVQEVIRDGENGLLADFYDIDALGEKALAVLRDPIGFRLLADAGARTIRNKFGLDQCAGRFVELCSRVTRAAITPSAATPSCPQPMPTSPEAPRPQPAQSERT